MKSDPLPPRDWWRSAGVAAVLAACGLYAVVTGYAVLLPSAGPWRGPAAYLLGASWLLLAVVVAAVLWDHRLGRWTRRVVLVALPLGLALMLAGCGVAELKK